MTSLLNEIKRIEKSREKRLEKSRIIDEIIRLTEIDLKLSGILQYQQREILNQLSLKDLSLNLKTVKSLKRTITNHLQPLEYITNVQYSSAFNGIERLK